MRKRIKSWWCNPGRWQMIVIYLALAAWFVGMFIVNNSLIVWNTTMHTEREKLQNQIDLLGRHEHINQGVQMPEGGP